MIYNEYGDPTLWRFLLLAVGVGGFILAILYWLDWAI